MSSFAQGDAVPDAGVAPSLPLHRELLRSTLESTTRRKLSIEGFAPAAVLVPIMRRAEELFLGYTLRPDEMPTHAGQISFPGGRRDPDDADLVATALRETEEELGIGHQHIEVLGKIDDVPTPVGFVITPVVGWLIDPPEPVIDKREVGEYFEVSVDELSNPVNFKDRGEREIAGVGYPVPEFHVAGRLIWGATARITQRLLQIGGLAAD